MTGGLLMDQLQRQDLMSEQAYVGRQWVEADSGKTIEDPNPATGAVIGVVPDMGAEETRRAIAAAQDAFQQWRHVPAKERAQIMRRWFDLMMQHQEDLARRSEERRVGN